MTTFTEEGVIPNIFDVSSLSLFLEDPCPCHLLERAFPDPSAEVATSITFYPDLFFLIALNVIGHFIT